MSSETTYWHCHRVSARWRVRISDINGHVTEHYLADEEKAREVYDKNMRSPWTYSGSLTRRKENGTW